MIRGAMVTKAILLLLGFTLSLSGCVAEPVGYSYDRYPYDPIYGGFGMYGAWDGWHHGWDHGHWDHRGWGHGFAHRGLGKDGGLGRHGGFGGHGGVGGHGGSGGRGGGGHR